jgi:hypothetical protein
MRGAKALFGHRSSDSPHVLVKEAATADDNPDCLDPTQLAFACARNLRKFLLGQER